MIQLFFASVLLLQKGAGSNKPTLPFALPFGLNMFQAGILLLIALFILILIILVLKKMIHRKTKKKNRTSEAVTHTLELTGSVADVLVGNSQNIGRRENQQDAFAVSDVNNSSLCMKKGIFAVVADGMGGLSDGSEISNIAVSVMLDYFNEYNADGNAPHALREMLMTANEKVNAYLADHGNIKGGSTAVAIILHQGALSWISAGDSRIYLFRSNRIWLLNEATNLANELDDKVLAGKITRQEAENDAERNALTSYLGIEEMNLYDANVEPFTLQAGDKILLCSDGVFGTLTEEEIAGAMEFSAPMAAEEIEKMVIAKEKPSQDNMTAVILEPLRLSI